MKVFRLIGKWILGLILLCLVLVALASIRFGIVDFPEPDPVRAMFLDD